MPTRSRPCMASGRWLRAKAREERKTAKETRSPDPSPNTGQQEETAMSKSFKALGLAVGALALTHLPAAAQTKVTNQGISADEIVIGTHQELSGPLKVDRKSTR